MPSAFEIRFPTPRPKRKEHRRGICQPVTHRILVAQPDFESLVDAHYSALYRFGLSLTRSEAEASDLTQQTFYIWASKGHQLRDKSKAKAWLFTTLHRQFLETRRGAKNFASVALDDAGPELPSVSPPRTDALDGPMAVAALRLLDESFRAPLTLFYLEDLSYAEIAVVLDIPIGTVMSRLSRGKEQLRRALESPGADLPTSIVLLPSAPKRASRQS